MLFCVLLDAGESGITSSIICPLFIFIFYTCIYLPMPICDADLSSPQCFSINDICFVIMVLHVPSALVGSIVAGSGFLLIHRELSHRRRLTTKWELQEYAELQWKEWRQSTTNPISDTAKVREHKWFGHVTWCCVLNRMLLMPSI